MLAKLTSKAIVQAQGAPVPTAARVPGRSQAPPRPCCSTGRLGEQGAWGLPALESPGLPSLSQTLCPALALPPAC